jgi:hypothetical protein
LPRRRRTRSRRPRETQGREREASSQPEARPALSVVSREETEERAAPAPRRVPPSAGTATKAAPRHISQDYSYVPGELRRIAITVAIIIAGLIGAAIALR